MFNSSVLAENIKKFRKSKKITQKELSEMLRVTPQAVSRWECDLSAPDISNLYDLSAVLGVTVDALIGNDATSLKKMIAVDGGGSKTEFVLFDETGRILSRNILGGSNPNIYGIEGTAELLKSGIDLFLGQYPNPAGIYIGCAGFGALDNARKVKGILNLAYPHIKIGLKSDIYNVVASATEEEKCIAAICGTGVVAYALNGESLARFGGWGYLLDDGGSGFDIGRDVLRNALYERECNIRKSKLTELCETKFGGNIYDNFFEVYKKDISYIASYAEVCFDAYDKGDKKAEEIILKNAKKLSEYVNSASALHPDYKTVVMSGSVISKNKIYFNKMKEFINGKLNLVVPENPQVYGAAINCAKMCQVPLEDIKNNFMRCYIKGEF